MKPVANVAALKGLTGLLPGETRVTLDTQLPYGWTGTKWLPFAVDDNGALNFTKLVTAGSACGVDVNGTQQPNAVQIGVASDGEVLTCQGGVWTATSVILPGATDANCQVIYPSDSATPSDYGNCIAPNGQNQWDTVSSTMNNYVYRTVTLTRAALITATTYAHMNYAQCGQSGWLGQLTQYLDIMDSTGTTSYAHTEMQTPNISDASAGVSVTLNQPVPAGTYLVKIRTNWGAFTGPGANQQRWYSSYCPAGAAAGVVINTPLAMGWAVSTVY